VLEDEDMRMMIIETQGFQYTLWCYGVNLSRSGILTVYVGVTFGDDVPC
jgi:hypothetical protein